MASQGGTHADIEERLARLEQRYETVTVNQSTYEVEGERYRRVAEGDLSDVVDVQVVVRNEVDDVLLRERDSNWKIPQGTVGSDESPETAAKRIVRENAGVDCTIEDVASATIVGFCNSEDPTAETVYQLEIVFSAAIGDPPATPDEPVRWGDEPTAPSIESVR